MILFYNPKKKTALSPLKYEEQVRLEIEEAEENGKLFREWINHFYTPEEIFYMEEGEKETVKRMFLLNLKQRIKEEYEEIEVIL